MERTGFFMNIISSAQMKWKKKNTLQIIDKNYNIIILTILMGFGVIIGSIIISKASTEFNSSINYLYDNFVASIKERNFGASFFDTFFTSMVYIFLFFIAGTNALGVPFVYFLTCIKGIGNGIISGYLYMTFGIKGVGFATLVLFPYALLSAVAIILMGNSSLQMSRNIFSTLSGKFAKSNEITIKKYCVNFLIYTALFVLFSIIDAIFKASFSSNFSI